MLDEIWTDMIDAARSARGARIISDYVQAGEVSASVLSDSGKIYTGVCIDTACTLGVCAERNAVFNMITNGEQNIKRVVCIMGDGRVGGAPCGACRELMVQLMPNTYKHIEILISEDGSTVTLDELTPKWWIRDRKEDSHA